MKAKELKKLIELIPDDFEIGYKNGTTVCENWYGESYNEHFRNIDFEPNIDIKNKRVSMFCIKRRLYKMKLN